jgi:acyl carrier protein
MLIDVDDVCRTVGLVLGRRTVHPHDRLMEDHGAESIDLLSIVVALEQKHGVSIDEGAMGGVSTVRDLHQLVSRSPRAAIVPADPARTA